MKASGSGVLEEREHTLARAYRRICCWSRCHRRRNAPEIPKAAHANGGVHGILVWCRVRYQFDLCTTNAKLATHFHPPNMRSHKVRRVRRRARQAIWRGHKARKKESKHFGNEHRNFSLPPPASAATLPLYLCAPKHRTGSRHCMHSFHIHRRERKTHFECVFFSPAFRFEMAKRFGGQDICECVGGWERMELAEPPRKCARYQQRIYFFRFGGVPLLWLLFA